MGNAATTGDAVPIGDSAYLRETGLSSDLAREISDRGFVVRRQVIPADLITELRAAVSVGFENEARIIPPGDAQYGRLLFAPLYGGAFVNLLNHQAFDPIDDLVGNDSIIYTYTTSILRPGEPSPAHLYHRDIAYDRIHSRCVVMLVALTRFTEHTGATEFITGSTYWPESRVPTKDDATYVLQAEPGDVCYFHPGLLHRSGINRSNEDRVAVLVGFIPPWMKQRFDVRAMLRDQDVERGTPAWRRLGFEAFPPASIDEFIDNRNRRTVI